MRRLEGRVAIVTGAGRGLGRAHALLLADQGAHVVVNDLGADVRGEGGDPTPAQEVVAEIEDCGGKAVVSGHDVSDWRDAEELVRLAVETFGDLHVLVNNAGILRDRLLANMSEDEWDAVLRVHVKGHAAPTRHAVAHWRRQAKAGEEVRASVVHTTSVAGFVGNFGQANYSAAKAAILGLSQVVAIEYGRYGVRSNAVSPAARTRISATMGDGEGALVDDGFDALDPANVSPLVAWLAEADCPADRQVFHLRGERLIVASMPQVAHDLRTNGRWTADALDAQLAPRLLPPPTLDEWFDSLGETAE